MGNLTAFLFLVVLISIFGAIIWFSIKAKPLAPGPYQKPYGFATFIALTTGLYALYCALNILVAVMNGKVFGALLLTVLTCAGTCVQLMRRRRSGVSLFFWTYALIFFTPILLSSVTGRPTDQEAIEQSSSWLPYCLISAYYIWKRWHLFNMPTNLATRFDSVPDLPLSH